MRHPIVLAACLAGVTAVAGCGEKDANATVERAFKDVNVVDESNLSDVMLTVADPNEAVNYFARSIKEDPTRIDHQRGLASSLIRAKRVTEGVIAWEKVTKMEGATSEDSVNLADALIRAGNWTKAEKVLDDVPPTHETFKRYRLEALVADRVEKSRQLLRNRCGSDDDPRVGYEQLGLFQADPRRIRQGRTTVFRRDPSGRHAVHRQEQPRDCPFRAARLHPARHSDGPDRTCAIAAYDGPFGDQTRRSIHIHSTLRRLFGPCVP